MQELIQHVEIFFSSFFYNFLKLFLHLVELEKKQANSNKLKEKYMKKYQQQTKKKKKLKENSIFVY